MGVQRVVALKSPSSKEDALTVKFKSSHRINQRIERITMKHLIVGIDIAKDTHVAGAVNARGIQLGRVLSFSNDRFGFEKLMRWVADLQKTHSLTSVIFGAESTGHYFLNLVTWLRDRSEQVVLVNPMTTKRNKENRDNKPSKSDAKDAITMADAVSRGFYNDWVVPEAAFTKLRCLVNERESITDLLTALGNQIQTVLDQVFPEFISVIKEWDCPRGLATLRAFPLPDDLKGLSPEQVIEGWYSAGMKRAGGSRGRERAALLIAAAKGSIGVTETAPELKRQIERQLQSVTHLQQQRDQVDQAIAELLDQLPQETLHPFTTLGISPWLTAVLLANAGHLGHYDHGNQLLALAGLNLAERQSGKYKGQIKLSKRGRRQLRKYLYLLIIGFVSNNEFFRQLHKHNVSVLRMKKQKSIFKLIGKLARMLVSLAQSGEAFDLHKASGIRLQAA